MSSCEWSKRERERERETHTHTHTHTHRTGQREREHNGFNSGGYYNSGRHVGVQGQSIARLHASHVNG